MTPLRPAICALLVAPALACGQSGAGTGARPYPLPEVSTEGKVVAKVGDVVLTTKEMEKRIQQQSPFLRQQLKDPEQKKKFIENEVRIELLAQEGWRRKLYEDPRIIAELKRSIVQRLMREQSQAAGAKVEVSEQELADAYARKEAEFSKPEKVRLSEILLRAATPEAKADARKRLEAIRTEIEREKKKHNNQLAFADAARKYSDDEATKRGGGDLQFLTREDAVRRYGEAGAVEVFDKLEIAAQVITETTDGVALVEKTGRRRAVTRTLEMVKPQIRGQIINDKRAAVFDGYVNELMQQHGVELDDAALKEIEVNMNAPTLPGANEGDDD